MTIELEIITDTREQSPIYFNHPYIKEVTRKKLDYGDYSCKFGDRVAPMFFERKSIGDLFGTFGKGNKRFRAEIQRCFDDGNELTIIVEESLQDIYGGFSFSTMSGQQITRTLFTLFLKYNIRFVCCASRREMAIYIQEYYYSWAKNLEFLDGKNNC
jgi:ERCC4-type nuclease